MNNIILILITILILTATPAFAKKPWGGVYSGPEYPGREILQSRLVWRDGYMAPTARFDLATVMEGMVDQCKDIDGEALTNLKVSISLGDASVGKEGVTQTYSPAIQAVVFADCVTLTALRQ